MSSTMVLEALRKSKKGNLKYDGSWHADGLLQDVITKASSPPPISMELITHSLQKLQISASQNDLGNSFIDHTPPKVLQSLKEEVVVEVQNNSERNNTDEFHSSYSDALNQARENRAAKIQVAIQEYESEIEREAKEQMLIRKKEHEMFSQDLEKQAKQNIILLEQRMELQQRALWQKINDVNTESEEQRERRLLHQQERHRLHLKKLDNKMKIAQQQKQLAELEKQKRKQAELESYLQSLAKVKGQIDDQATRIIKDLEACPHQEQLAPKGNEIKSLAKRLQAKAEQLVQNARQSKPSEEAFQFMTVLIQKIMDLSNLSSAAIAEAEKLAQKAEEEALQKAKEAAAAKPTPVQETPKTSVLAPSSISQGVLSDVAHPDSLEEYNKLQENLKSVQKSYEGLKQSKDKDLKESKNARERASSTLGRGPIVTKLDEVLQGMKVQRQAYHGKSFVGNHIHRCCQLKKYCFDIQKAINTPINAVSSQSGAHFMDKLRRLQNLLNGQTVEVGTKKVSAVSHPAGMAFCKELLAKKLVKQGQEQVSSNYKSAFPFAALAVGLWSQYPDVGDLILANFHHQCPFLVPYHIAKTENQSNEEYYKLLGYLYDDEGNIEKQDKYLKRMSGFTRLYAAILVSNPPPGCGQVNPFGLEKAWQWLSRLLNLEPQPDITATMLFDFLEVCGFAMAKAYDKQFFKLIQILIQGYFPKIEAVTPKGSGGPVTRLKSYLQNCLKSQTFPPPPGLLSPGFWRSY